MLFESKMGGNKQTLKIKKDSIAFICKSDMIITIIDIISTIAFIYAGWIYPSGGVFSFIGAAFMLYNAHNLKENSKAIIRRGIVNDATCCYRYLRM